MCFSSSFWFPYIKHGHGSKSRTPPEHPNPVCAPTPKWDPKTVLPTTATSRKRVPGSPRGQRFLVLERLQRLEANLAEGRLAEWLSGPVQWAELVPS